MLRITLAAATLFVAGTAFAQVTSEGDRVEVKGMEMYYEGLRHRRADESCCMAAS